MLLRLEENSISGLTQVLGMPATIHSQSVVKKLEEKNAKSLVN